MKRRPLTDKRREAIWLFHDGRCGECGLPVPMAGPDVEYDHEIAIWLGGPDDDGPNMRPLHRSPCHRKVKTPRDAKVIAKVKRLIARNEGTRRPRQAIKSQGFNKRLRRKMNGRVEKRGKSLDE